MSKKNIIEINNLSVSYKVFKLHAVTFDIYEGINAIIGPNGAGKTTIIKSIMGGITNLGPEGKITIAKNINVAYIPEKNFFENKIRVIKFLKQWFKFYNPNQKFHIDNLIQDYPDLNVASLLNMRMETLSSGQLRRVLIFKALLNYPNLIIMDEPFINLDPDNIINFFKIIRKMKEHKITVLIASHMLAEIEKYLDFVHIIYLGKMIYSKDYVWKRDGSLYQIYQKFIPSKLEESNEINYNSIIKK